MTIKAMREELIAKFPRSIVWINHIHTLPDERILFMYRILMDIPGEENHEEA